MVGQLLQVDVVAQKIPAVILAGIEYANRVASICTHVGEADLLTALRALDHACEFVEWYCLNSRVQSTQKRVLDARWSQILPARSDNKRPALRQNPSIIRSEEEANTSPMGSLRDANGLIYIRVGRRKLLCFEQFPESTLFIP